MFTPNINDHRKVQILDVAYEMFSNLPYELVTMRSIARKAALSIGGLYWHFKSKEEILSVLLSQNAENHLIFLQKLLETNASPSCRLNIFFEGMIEHICNMSNNHFSGAKYHVMINGDPIAISIIERIGESYRSGLCALIEQGIEAGEFVPVNSQNAAMTIIATYEGTVLLWRMSPEKICLRDTLRTSTKILLQGLTRVQVG